MDTGIKLERLDLKFSGDIYKNKDGTRVPDDQFVVFLAKDDAFPVALEAYLAECIRLGAGQAQIDAVKLLMDRVDSWREGHPELCRTPDVEPGELEGSK